MICVDKRMAQPVPDAESHETTSHLDVHEMIDDLTDYSVAKRGLRRLLAGMDKFSPPRCDLEQVYRKWRFRIAMLKADIATATGGEISVSEDDRDPPPNIPPPPPTEAAVEEVEEKPEEEEEEDVSHLMTQPLNLPPPTVEVEIVDARPAKEESAPKRRKK